MGVKPPSEEVVLGLAGQFDHIAESIDSMLVHLISPFDPHPAREPIR